MKNSLVLNPWCTKVSDISVRSSLPNYDEVNLSPSQHKISRKEISPQKSVDKVSFSAFPQGAGGKMHTMP
jgi:hypothetical protein